MKESFLHLVWQQQLFHNHKLRTIKGEELRILQKGMINSLRGPDFGNAIIMIDGQKWAGNIEIHVKSSDWYAHQHQKDKNYNNVILHVVYEHDVDVFDLQNNVIPTFELKDYIDKQVLLNYNTLISNRQDWVFCEQDLKQVDGFTLSNWLERIYIERLERKVNEVGEVYKKTNKDWEATLFLMLAKYFGGNLNGILFLEAFSQVDYSVIRKQMVNNTTGSLLFGLLNLLEENDIEDVYYQSLQKEYIYQKQKYKLTDLRNFVVYFYGCRPQNFPTIRLSQLIVFYEQNLSVFHKINTLKNDIDSYRDLFKIEMPFYWQTHYNFSKLSKRSPKKISKGFVNLLLINVVFPVLFFYNKTNGKDNSYLLDLMYSISPEKNSIVTKFKNIGYESKSALETQALLTLKKEYCDKERCAECAIGMSLMRC